MAPAATPASMRRIAYALLALGAALDLGGLGAAWAAQVPALPETLAFTLGIAAVGAWMYGLPSGAMRPVAGLLALLWGGDYTEANEG